MNEVYWTEIVEDDMTMPLTRNRPPSQTAGNVKKLIVLFQPGGVCVKWQCFGFLPVTLCVSVGTGR
mgnify:CR=1 FL=1